MKCEAVGFPSPPFTNAGASHWHELLRIIAAETLRNLYGRGWGAAVGGGERLRPASGQCSLDAGRSQLILDLGRTCAAVVKGWISRFPERRTERWKNVL